jgi:hypothetical protein
MTPAAASATTPAIGVRMDGSVENESISRRSSTRAGFVA